MYLIQLAQNHLDIAKSELIELGLNPVFKEYFALIPNLVPDLHLRLAYSKEICELINYDPDDLKKTNWDDIINGSFAVQSHSSSLTKELAAVIYNSLQRPVVDLNDPHTVIRVFKLHSEILVGKLIHKISSDFLKRKPHKKPEMHPSSMDPRLAKACVNLTGLKSGTICDPFCGSGGILVEAGLMNFNIVGVDLHEEMILMCKKNLDFFNLTAELFIEDATKFKLNCDAIVTDLPYGKNTKLAGDINTLAESFLENAAKHKVERIVMMLPDYANPKLNKYKQIETFTFYLHKSLSKKILVLVKIE